MSSIRRWVVRDGDRFITSFERESDARAFANMLNKNVTIIDGDDPSHFHCRCGSGLEPRWFYDARGIELFKGCDKCAPEKLRAYRPEVLTDPNYEADEPIEPEE